MCSFLFGRPKYIWFVGKLPSGKIIMQGPYLTEKEERQDRKRMKYDKNYVCWKDRIKNELKLKGVTTIKEIELFAKTPAGFRDEITRTGIQI
jgi:hypothetical protein